MVYRHSEALQAWTLARAASLRTLCAGRPPSVGGPLAHAYIIAVLTEFQAFVRDLHNLAVDAVMVAAASPSWLAPLLIDTMARARAIDGGDPTMDRIKSDFRRLGLAALDLGRTTENGRRIHEISAGASSYATELRMRT